MKWRSFGSLSTPKVEQYIEWVKYQLAKQEVVDEGIIQTWDWIVNCRQKTITLMQGGPDAYTDWVAGELCKLPPHVQIYPLLNEEWKSDAWLTGLAWSKIKQKRDKLNKENIAYALPRNLVKLPRGMGKIEMKGDWLAVIIDDATYSGTQAFDLFETAKQIFPPNPKMALIVAGASQKAVDKLKKVAAVNAMQQMPVATSAPYGLRKLPGYDAPIELDPEDLRPRFTKSEFGTFSGISYAILPYKIPDSVSVPTHVYAAYGYQAIPRPASRIPSQRNPIPFMKHLFDRDGGVDYRTTMPKGQDYFAKPI